MRQAVIQKAEERQRRQQPNLTGIPTQMKLDFEQRSGLSFDDVRVHYNSDKPKRIGALAYTQIPQVHIGPGQERHLRHELGHVVQQKQGIVRPTTWINGLPVNDSIYYENMASAGKIDLIPPNNSQTVIQKMGKHDKEKKPHKRPRTPGSEYERAAKKRKLSSEFSGIVEGVARELDDGMKALESRSDTGLKVIKYGANQSRIYLRAPNKEDLRSFEGCVVSTSVLAKILSFDGKFGLTFGPASYKGHENKQFMRWVSTAFSYLVHAKDEIQCYLQDKTIIVSANTNATLRKIKDKIKIIATLDGLLNECTPTTGVGTDERVKRHVDKLKRKRGNGYMLQAVTDLDTEQFGPSTATDGLHAEVRIVLQLGERFDIDNVGGLRPPCMCCAYVLLKAAKLSGTDIERNYESGTHPIYRMGPLWPSRSAVKGVVAYLMKSEKCEEGTLVKTAVDGLTTIFKESLMTTTARYSQVHEAYCIRTDQDCDSDSEAETDD